MLARVVCVGLLATAVAAATDTGRMWRELEAHCGKGLCALAVGSRLSPTANSTDCKGRLLAYE